MNYDEKEIRKLAHLEAQKMNQKALFIGSTIFILPHGLLALIGTLNLWVYIPVCILFLLSQAVLYMLSYKLAKAIILYELK